MKLKLIPRTRLVSGARVTPDGEPLPRPSDAPLEEKRERLYRAIEQTQRFMHPNASPEETMETIRRHYPAPVFFLEASRKALTGAGLPRLDAFYYTLIPGLTRLALSQQWGPNPRLDALSKMADYLRTLYVGVHVECFYLILLNGRGDLIRSVLLQKGGVDNAPFYLGDLLSAALTEDAKFIALAHNHPGGTRKPSKEDLYCTLRTLNAVEPLKLPLLDHLIVARGEVISIRESGLIPDMLWTAPAPKSRIVRDWQDVSLLEEYASRKLNNSSDIYKNDEN